MHPLFFILKRYIFTILFWVKYILLLICFCKNGFFRAMSRGGHSLRCDMLWEVHLEQNWSTIVCLWRICKSDVNIISCKHQHNMLASCSSLDNRYHRVQWSMWKFTNHRYHLHIYKLQGNQCRFHFLQFQAYLNHVFILFNINVHNFVCNFLYYCLHTLTIKIIFFKRGGNYFTLLTTSLTPLAGICILIHILKSWGF